MPNNSILLEKLRKQLKEEAVDGFIVGSGDCHQSEYVSSADKRREFISNFSGSAGTALILQDKALLWTDGRYFLQASKELSDDWILMKSGQPGVLELDQWIIKNVPEGTVVGVDSYLISTAQAKSMIKLFQSKDIKLKSVDNNPIDALWSETGAKPSYPSAPLKVHDSFLAGKSYVQKITDIQALLSKKSLDALVISMLDEIAWLFNIRGSDIEFNPVVISYAVVTLGKSYLFIDSKKLSNETRNYFDSSIVEILPYESIESFLKSLAEEKKMVWIDPSQLNWRLSIALSDSVFEAASPITLLKSIKNTNEINGIRESHIRDGVALTAFLHWLEQTIQSSNESISEFDVTVKIEEFRQKMPYHVSPSFDTIAGYGPNGAIIHYKPKKEDSALLSNDSLFLLDSGAQYLDGTTDVTRTVHFGNPTQRMIDCFTLVLKGHIAIAEAVFPEGTLGSRLDSLARIPLWNAGLDYNHGTGHGVGAYLNVHEGPQSIGFRKRDNEEGFTSGMTISNEPGYYEEGNFGIRIENICLTVEAQTPNNFNGKKYCKFENFTLVPIKTTLINKDLLDSKEINYINNYHSLVREKLIGLMKEYFPESVDYLIKETEPI